MLRHNIDVFRTYIPFLNSPMYLVPVGNLNSPLPSILCIVEIEASKDQLVTTDSPSFNHCPSEATASGMHHSASGGLGLFFLDLGRPPCHHKDFPLVMLLGNCYTLKLSEIA